MRSVGDITWLPSVLSVSSVVWYFGSVMARRQ